MFAMMGWGAYRTAPYISTYGITALRDAVLWGYAIYALIVASLLISKPERLRWVLGAYRCLAKVFLCIVPVLWVVQQLWMDSFPKWPWAEVTMVELKGGDINVHVGGILAFAMAGFLGGANSLWLIPLAAAVGTAGVLNRGGLVSFATAFLIALAWRPESRWAWGMVAAGLIGFAALAILDVHVKMPGETRDISARQLVENVGSIMGHNENESDLRGTTDWRMNWWNTIIDYTWHGPYFWSGKGFGINLADSDGFQVEADDSLRSPHNGHLTMLARAGVPGFVLWILVHATWMLVIFSYLYRSHIARQRQWAGLFMFLLAYGAAFMVNTCFDVFIEGPMGGIWYWSLYGVGIAAMWAYRHRPDVLMDRESHRSEASPADMDAI